MSPLCLILIDGCRPDALALAATPAIDSVILRGAFTGAARSVVPSSTLPCHQSIFHGVPPGRHGIVTNTFTPFVRPVAGLIETIRDAGGRCAMFYNWEPLRDVAVPGALEASFFTRMPPGDLSAGDSAVANVASDWLTKNAWDFAFVYLGATDEVGHKHGWMSGPYLRAIEHADACIAKLLPAIAEATVIVTADHGGHDRTHGTDCDEDTLIPFAIAGPGIDAGTTIDDAIDLTQYAAIICQRMGIPPSDDWTRATVRLA